MYLGPAIVFKEQIGVRANAVSFSKGILRYKGAFSFSTKSIFQLKKKCEIGRAVVSRMVDSAYWGALVTAKDPVWTCEIDSKARASQRDAVPDTACKFENIEHFIHAGALAEMKKVKGKHGGKRFQKWWAIAKKATFNTHAYCTQHLRKHFG